MRQRQSFSIRPFLGIESQFLFSECLWTKNECSRFFSSRYAQCNVIHHNMKLERKDCRFPLDTVDVYKEVMRLSLTFPWRRRIEIIFIGPNPCDFLIFPPPARSSHSCPVHCIIALFKKDNRFSYPNGGLVSLRSKIETVSAELWLQLEPRVWFLASLFSQLIIVMTRSLYFETRLCFEILERHLPLEFITTICRIFFYISNQKFRQFSYNKVKKKVIFSGIFHRHKYLKFIENILSR